VFILVQVAFRTAFALIFIHFRFFFTYILHSVHFSAGCVPGSFRRRYVPILIHVLLLFLQSCITAKQTTTYNVNVPNLYSPALPSVLSELLSVLPDYSEIVHARRNSHKPFLASSLLYKIYELIHVTRSQSSVDGVVTRLQTGRSSVQIPGRGEVNHLAPSSDEVKYVTSYYRP
jgi:hypothetical protein